MTSTSTTRTATINPRETVLTQVVTWLAENPDHGLGTNAAAEAACKGHVAATSTNKMSRQRAMDEAVRRGLAQSTQIGRRRVITITQTGRDALALRAS